MKVLDSKKRQKIKRIGWQLAGLPFILIGCPVYAAGKILKALGNLFLWDFRDAEREMSNWF